MLRIPRRTGARFVVRWIFALAGALLCATAARAQEDPTGTISGRVIDEGTGLGIPLASITVVGTSESATSDWAGSFNIAGVRAGAVALFIDKSDYQPANVTDIQVVAGETARVDVPLATVSSDVIRMEAFTVSADILEESGIGLLLTRQKSVGVSDAISADEMSRLSVGNAAEALGKTPGTSVLDGKYVVIRGLGDRYTNTQMNGSSVPSADPDRRAVQMDQFPSDVIDSVTTLKSFTPDQPGAFSGGSVNIKTKSFPDAFFFRASVKTSYTDGVTGEDLLTVPGGGRDWQGRDDGTRALGAGVPNPVPQNINAARARILATQGDFSVAEQIDAIAHGFNNEVYYPHLDEAGWGAGGGLSIGDSFETESGAAFGYVTSLIWDRSFSHYSDGISSRYSQGSNNAESDAFVDVARVFTPDVSEYNFAELYELYPDVPGGPPAFGVTRSAASVDWGAYAQIAWRPRLDHEFTLTAFHNQSAEDQVKRGIGEATRSDSGGEFRENYDLLYTERGVTSFQLAGKSHFLGANESTLDWRISRSRSTQDQPDYRNFEFKWSFILQAYDPSGLFSNRYFRELQEDSTEFALDYTQPISIGDGDLTLKFGGVYSDGERTNRERAFLVQTATVVDRESIESYPNPVGIVDRTANSVTFGTVMQEVQANLNYDGTQEIAAGYLMADWRVDDAWRLIGGARHETTLLTTTPLTTGNIEVTPGEIDQNDVLPAFSTIWSPFKKQNFRFSYGRTLARPTYRELADVVNYEAFTDEFIGGNPELELTLIDNYDLRWEWFPRGGEVVALSLFYKQLDQPIEQRFNAGRIFPENNAEGTVYGVELEARRRMDWIGPAFENLTVGFNLSFIESEVEIAPAELALIRAVFPDAKDTRDLYGQSPYILNLDATYEIPAWRSTFTVAYNVTGKRLDLVTTGALPDVYEQPSPALDLIVTRRFGDRWKLKLSARNLLDAEREKSFTHNGTTYFYERFRTGRSFSLSLGYDFN